MGRCRGPRYDGGVRRYLSPRCIGLHVTLLVLLPLFAWLTWWQLNRAEGGNSLSWAYVVLWPAFAVYAVYTWWHLVHDQVAKASGRSARVAKASGRSDRVATSERPGLPATSSGEAAGGVDAGTAHRAGP